MLFRLGMTQHNSLAAQSVSIVVCAQRGKKRSWLGDDAEHGYCSASRNQIVVEEECSKSNKVRRRSMYTTGGIATMKRVKTHLPHTEKPTLEAAARVRSEKERHK